MEHNDRIGAIVVLYNPDKDLLMKGLQTLSPQVDQVCIIDNTPNTDIREWFNNFENIYYIPLGKNIGIAAAQNKAIKYLIGIDCNYILFSDQDSTMPIDTVSKLYKATLTLIDNGYKVAAVGTRAINRQNGRPYPPKSKEFKHISLHNYENKKDALTECYSVISSVSLIPTISLLAVGGFDESLFIDGVDHEWCWRAWHTNRLRSFIVEDASIDHMLGEGDKSFAGKEIAISSAFRVYYQFRNFLWLYRRNYSPSFWRHKNLKKFIIKAFYFPIFVSPRMGYCKNILRGIKDGMKLNPIGLWPNFLQKND